MTATMMLTLKPQQPHTFGHFNAYSPVQRSPASYLPSSPKSVALPSIADNKERSMSTPHRGLPPPSVMERPSALERSLPNPERAPLSVNNLSLGSLPAAPSQWGIQDESMRTWLHAKSEEDKRKQEEEKSRQENLRLEQRRIEQTMLQDSLRGGIPPPMVPMIFASMGGGNIGNMSIEWAQQYMNQLIVQQQQQAQIQQQQQHQQQHHQQQQQPLPQIPQQIAAQIQPSPDQRRDTRLLTGPSPNPYGSQQMQPPSQGLNQAVQSNQTTPNMGNVLPAYQTSALAAERTRAQQPTLQAAPPTSNPRPPIQQGTMSRLNTGDLQAQPPPAGPSLIQVSGQHPLQQTQSAQAQEQGSDTLHFHHYVPPDPSGKKDPGTPSGKSQQGSPHGQNPSSHLRSEYTTSPKKRKATGSHHPAPEPSPSFSHQSSGSSNRRRRSRQRSDASTRGMTDFPNRQHTDSNRQSFSEAESSRNSAQPETRQPQNRHPAGSDGREMRQTSRDLSDRSSPKREP